MSKLSERLKQARAHLGMTQEDVAEAIGAKKRGYQDNESGKTTPRSDVIHGFVNLGFNANWLLTGEGPMLIDNKDNDDQKRQKDMLAAALDEDDEAELRRDDGAISRVNEIIVFNNLLMKGLAHLEEDQAKLWNAVISDLIQRRIVSRDDVLSLLRITKS